MKFQSTPAAEKITQYPESRHYLRQNSSQGGPLDPPTEHENKNRIEYYVDNSPDNHRHHRNHRISLGADKIVHPKAHGVKNSALKDYTHIFSGKREHGVTGAKQF